MRYGAMSASFPPGEIRRRRLLFVVAASFLLGAALALLAAPTRRSAPDPPAEELRLALFTAPLEHPTPADFTDVEWFRVE